MVTCNARRLFFALRPDKALRQQIQSATFPRLKSKAIPPENWHITLVFLGDCTATEQARFVTVVDNIRVEPFRLNLDTTGQFSHARVAWLGCRQCPEALRNFQQALVTQLSRALDQPYIPHLSLYRNISSPYQALPLSPILWKVDRFLLLASNRGDQLGYRTLKTWRLAA